jgi:DNA-binding response OmpR family regulator
MEIHQAVGAGPANVSLNEVIRLDPALPGIRAGELDVRLTKTEFRLLEYLAARQPRWVKTGELLDNVLPQQVTRDTTLVRVHLLNIRKKLGALSRCLSTERRLGTRLLGVIVESAQR